MAIGSGIANVLGRTLALPATLLALTGTALAHGPAETMADTPEILFEEDTGLDAVRQILNDDDPQIVEAAHALITISYAWPTNTVLDGCFLDGSRELRQFFLDVGRMWLWEQVHLTIDFGASPGYRDCASVGNQARVRVTFVGDDNKAYVGTAGITTSVLSGPSVWIGEGDNTIFAFLDRALLTYIVLHEWGHVFGLEHTHQNPTDPCSADLDLVALKRWLRTLNPAMTDRQLDEFIQRNYTPILTGVGWTGTGPGPHAMLYQWPIQVLRSGSRSPCIEEMAQRPSNEELAALAIMYPATRQEQRENLQRAALLLAQHLHAVHAPATVALELTAIDRLLSNLDLEVRDQFRADLLTNDLVTPETLIQIDFLNRTPIQLRQGVEEAETPNWLRLDQLRLPDIQPDQLGNQLDLYFGRPADL